MASRRTSGNVTGEVDRVDIRLVDASWGKGERKPHRSIDAKRDPGMASRQLWNLYMMSMRNVPSLHWDDYFASVLGADWVMKMCCLWWLSLWAFPPDLPTFCSLQVWVKYVSRPSLQILSPGFTSDFPEGFGNARSLGGWSIMSTDTPWNCHRRVLTLLVMFQGLLQMWNIASTWIRTTPELHSPSLIPNRGLLDWESLGMTSRLGIFKPFFLPRSCLTFRLEFLDQKKTQESPPRNDAPWILKQLKQKTRRRGCVQDSWTSPHLALGFHQEAQS